jgi:hypothetical protein
MMATVNLIMRLRWRRRPGTGRRCIKCGDRTFLWCWRLYFAIGEGSWRVADRKAVLCDACGEDDP